MFRPARLGPSLGLSAALLSFTLAGCAGSAESAPPSATPSAPSATALLTATPSATPPTATPHPNCPLPLRGPCLGLVPAGTYTTVEFEPPITYTIPSGWSNFEDLAGLFLLVPPGFDLRGVDEGGSDYIGIYTSVVAANANCTETAQPNVGHTAAALAAEFAHRPGLMTTTPKPVSVGGLRGLVLDIRMATGWKKACFYSGGKPVVPLIRGVGNSSGLDTPIGETFMMRLYLLDHSGITLAIELGDNFGGKHVNAYSAIVNQLHFGS